MPGRYSRDGVDMRGANSPICSRQPGGCMRRRTDKRLLLAMFTAGIALGAAPRQGDGPPPPPNAAKAAASYHAVTKAIDEATRPWDQSGATAPAAAPGWRAFFDALKSELATYATSTGTN